ncbi:hypothetical protein BRC90_06860 [Halobacteriales archaeon QS_4_69_34]|nr:MAG: hypothetical protein BRC90_06860 [Halobacteriales archaeon QS_4_69_34]
MAAAIPEAYDAVQRDLDAPTRSEKEWNWYGEEDPDERRRWARRHREEWRAVQRGEQRPPGARTELETRGHRSFAPFRFPVSPYDALQSPFVREEIRRGTFDDIEYRRYVNKLAWIEWYTTDWEQGGAWGPVITNWRIASEYPEEFDIVRRELDEETRASLDLSGGIYYGDIDAEAAAREYKRSWQAVQETARDGFPSQTTGSEARRNP